MISKEIFIKAIGDIKNINDYGDALYSLNKEFNVDGWIFGLDGINTVLYLLKEIFKDKDEWIDYFVFELNYGKDYKQGMIKDGDGKEIDLSTSDKLYDFLIENMQGRD